MRLLAHSKRYKYDAPAAQRYHHQALCTLVDTTTLRDIHGVGSGRRFVRRKRERMPRLLLRMRMAASFRWGLKKSVDLVMVDALVAVVAVVAGAIGQLGRSKWWYEGPGFSQLGKPFVSSSTT
jgi:hypothetical protein